MDEDAFLREEIAAAAWKRGLDCWWQVWQTRAVWRTIAGRVEAVLHERIRLRGIIDDRMAIWCNFAGI